MKGRGFDLPLGVGEYNGYSAKTIADAGEALMSTPNVWFGCMWNATGDKGWELTGDRLTAFQDTLADPRAPTSGDIGRRPPVGRPSWLGTVGRDLTEGRRWWSGPRVGWCRWR